MSSKYPITDIEEPKRPFRLWNAEERQQLAHRCYKYPKKAHMAALIETRWAKVGHTIEVFNTANGRLLGQYTRKLNNIEFRGA